MNETPKGLRAHIAVLGRRNAGKSSLINAISGQQVAIVSPTPGTTTDPVEKTMELLPFGPVVLVDTAGTDDVGSLGKMRVARTLDIVKRSDAAILVCDGARWEEEERNIAALLRERGLPFIVARNKIDQAAPMPDAEIWKTQAGLEAHVPVLDISAKNGIDRKELAETLFDRLNDGGEEIAPLLRDLLPPGGVVVFVVPLDTGAPKGRLILPQVQAIRDVLDGEKISLVVTESQYATSLDKLASPPNLVVCDSQVVNLTAQKTPHNVPLTTFSILMARFKGDLSSLAAGAGALQKLAPGDSVLIQEACSHHPQADDIGRVKIPRLLNRLAGGELDYCWSAGKELADYRKKFKAIVHCGACVITRTQMLARMGEARAKNIPITNYGMAISLANGVLERVLSPFPMALEAFKAASQ